MSKTKELRNTIRECYRNYLSDWAKMPIEELVNKADEVSLITKIAKILPDVITEESADNLCKYVDPINAVFEMLAYRNRYAYSSTVCEIEGAVQTIVIRERDYDRYGE